MIYSDTLRLTIYYKNKNITKSLNQITSCAAREI